MILGKFYTPVRFKFARKHFGKNQFKILDVGCGNYSPSLTKRWFPNSIYHGADIQEYKLSAADHSALDEFFTIGPNGRDGYASIPNDSYDFVILNHVIEHIVDQEAAIRSVCSKLKPGGLIWIAFPSPKSLNFPSGVGTLNFCDDPTHVRVCDAMSVANMLLNNEMSIIKGGPSRDFLRLLVGLAILPAAIFTKLWTGKFQIRGLWYVFGFEHRVLGYRKTNAIDDESL